MFSNLNDSVFHQSLSSSSVPHSYRTKLIFVSVDKKLWANYPLAECCQSLCLKHISSNVGKIPKPWDVEARAKRDFSWHYTHLGVHI